MIDEEARELGAEVDALRREVEAWKSQVQTARDDRDAAQATAQHWRDRHDEVRAEMRLMESVVDEVEAYVVAAQNGDVDLSKLGAALAALREAQASDED